MDAIDRRGALRSILCGVAAAGLGLLPETAMALPLAAEEKDPARKTDDLETEAQAAPSRPPGGRPPGARPPVSRPRPHPVHRRHHRRHHRRRRKVCWWHRGRRVCAWRWV